MDSHWRSELYKPSIACESIEYQILDDETLENEINYLTAYTKEIQESPYDPEAWLNRSHSLQILGYPDLALGDIYKALLLVEAALSNCSILTEYTIPAKPLPLPQLLDHALKGRSSLGEKAILTYGIKMYLQYMTDPAYAKWKPTVATPQLLSKSAEGMLKRIEIQVWQELMNALLAANACHDYVELSRKAVVKFKNDPIFISEHREAKEWYRKRKESLESSVSDGSMSPSTMSTTMLYGSVYPIPYPWMGEDLLCRDDDFLAKIQAEYASVSTNCEVRRSTIRDTHFENGIELETEFDVLGVFALRDIEAGEELLVDRTIACVLNTMDRCPTCCGPLPNPKYTRPVTNPCCAKIYCSITCAETALAEYHQVECSQAPLLQQYYEDACEAKTDTTDSAMEQTLFIRVVANIVNEGVEHPLKSSFIQRLTPAYSSLWPVTFNWTDNIVKPTDILLALKIDVFANLEYDTWVIQTMRLRMQNNKHAVVFHPIPTPFWKIGNSYSQEAILGSSISPLYSMHNHSCEPNAAWNFLDGEGFEGAEEGTIGSCSSLSMYANRDIREGEEVCISYIEGLDSERAERCQLLVPWLGGDCRCEKCEYEKGDMVDGAAEEMGEEEETG